MQKSTVILASYLVMPQIDHPRVPSHWPRDVVYLSRSQYAPGFPASILHQMRLNPDTSLESQVKSGHKGERTSKKSSVAIRKISSPSHPAYSQNGLFVTCHIPPHTLILHYTGEIHVDERPSSDYDLTLFKARKTPSSSLSTKGDAQPEDAVQYEFVNVGIDAQRMGNEARFINDYRGTGTPRPNAFFKETYVDGELCMTVWSGKEGLQKGEEILVSYGKGWWDARQDLCDEV